MLHLAHTVDPDVPVVFFDSGLESPETYTYLEHLAELWDLNCTSSRRSPARCRPWPPPGRGTTAPPATPTPPTCTRYSSPHRLPAHTTPTVSVSSGESAPRSVVHQ